uniref:Minor capsid protein L2 n=1 Tax=Epsilonpapillomavirus 1 TaxID=40537 RepID=A0A165XUU9_9PAPI|nr:L2 [Epsilonpapillomavirus 1]
MAVRLRRVKRANPYDLYRTCATGDCPQDVKDRFEHNTIADKILKWGSAGVFLGGLGIGSTQARPGLGTYSPLGRGGVTGRIPVRGPGSTRPLGRPFSSGPIDTIGAGVRTSVETSVTVPDVVAVLPESPAVITPDSMPVDPGVGGLDISAEIIEEPSLTFVEPHGPEDVAVLDVNPAEHDRSVYLSSSTTHHNPSFQGQVTVYTDIGETSETENLLISGSNIGSSRGEEIQMQLFSGPKTSTPETDAVTKVRGRANWFSKRYYTQTSVRDPTFIQEPQTYFYGFENPAYEPDPFEDSFDVQLASPSEPVQPELRDITHVSAARTFRGESGRIGISRLGQKSSIQTRSGVTVGGRVHFRYSLSTIEDAIEDAEEIELQVTNGSQGPSGSLQHTAETILSEGHDAYVDVDMDSVGSLYSDIDLIDEHSETPHGILVFHDEAETDVVPVIDVSYVRKPLSTIPGSDLWPTNINIQNGPVDVDLQDSILPGIIITDSGVDGTYFLNTYLHPSLHKRKKRRFS